jgi:hypothetical protein
MSIYNSYIWIVYFLSIIFIIFLHQSSMGDVCKLIQSKYLLCELTSITGILWIFYILIFVFLGLPIALRVNIRVKDYYSWFFLIIATSYLLMPYLVIELAKTTLWGNKNFEVTCKESSCDPCINIFSDFKLSFLFIIFIYIGILKNPLAFVYSFIWILPLLFSPLVIYILQNDNCTNRRS